MCIRVMYNVTRTWIATDDCGNTATSSQLVSIKDDTAPTIASLPGPSTIECPAQPTFAVATATDSCDTNVTLTSSDTTSTGSCPGQYNVTRRWIASDDCGYTATAFHLFTIKDDTAP